MKVLILSSLIFSTASFAQSIDLQTFKGILLERQAVLESIHQGMSKKVSTVTKFQTDLGICEWKGIANQTILKIEGEKIIVHSEESFAPSAGPECEGFEAYERALVFFENKPSLKSDLSDLDASSDDILGIVKMGETVSMDLKSVSTNEDGTTQTEIVKFKYDLSKSLFKNIIYIQDSAATTIVEDAKDVDVFSIDLKNVLFCETADSEFCAEGDYSDILF